MMGIYSLLFCLHHIGVLVPASETVFPQPILRPASIGVLQDEKTIRWGI